MTTKLNPTQRIRAMVAKGHSNKDIIAKLQCKPQVVYNIRYQSNKERGLGSIGALPKPVNGIGEPPKRKYTRKVKAGTDIVSEPKPVIQPAMNAYQFTPMPKPTPMFEMQITMIEPKPTLWERIKRWFHG